MDNTACKKTMQSNKSIIIYKIVKILINFKVQKKTKINRMRNHKKKKAIKLIMFINHLIIKLMQQRNFNPRLKINCKKFHKYQNYFRMIN